MLLEQIIKVVKETNGVSLEYVALILKQDVILPSRGCHGMVPLLLELRLVPAQQRV